MGSPGGHYKENHHINAPGGWLREDGLKTGSPGGHYKGNHHMQSVNVPGGWLQEDGSGRIAPGGWPPKWALRQAIIKRIIT